MIIRGFHSSLWVNFGLGVSCQFKIGFYVYISFYLIVNPFLSRVKSGSISESGGYRIIGSVLKSFNDNPKLITNIK